MPELRNKLPETVDPAASADARMDGVAAGAEPIVLRLKVEAAVEIERRAILLEFGANPAPVGKHEVDLFLTGKNGAPDNARRNALRALALDPFDRWGEGARLDGNAKNHLVLDDQPSDRLLHRSGLHGGKAKQHREQAQKDCRRHLAHHHRPAGFAASR